MHYYVLARSVWELCGLNLAFNVQQSKFIIFKNVYDIEGYQKPQIIILKTFSGGLVFLRLISATLVCIRNKVN